MPELVATDALLSTVGQVLPALLLAIIVDTSLGPLPKIRKKLLKRLDRRVKSSRDRVGYSAPRHFLNRLTIAYLTTAPQLVIVLSLALTATGELLVLINLAVPVGERRDVALLSILIVAAGIVSLLLPRLVVSMLRWRFLQASW